jgi:DNA end-binding protein Ku
VLVLETMYWPDEIRAADFPELEKDAKLRPQEIQMARTLIDNLTEDFDPTQYHDGYREALLEVIEKKVAGEEIEYIEAPEPTKVVDLMEALKASVEAAKKPAAPTTSTAKKSTAKKSTAKKPAAKRSTSSRKAG